MRRYLVWHVPQVRGDDGSQGPVFYADHDYTPGALRLHARLAPNGADLVVDIRVDGESILTDKYAALNKGANLEEHAEDYPSREPMIAEGSVISFHIISTGGAEGITGTLEVDSISDQDDSSE